MGSMAFIFYMTGWLGGSLILEHLVLFQSILTHLDLESCTPFFFWITYFVRNFLTKVDIFFSIGSIDWEPVHPIFHG